VLSDAKCQVPDFQKLNGRHARTKDSTAEDPVGAGGYSEDAHLLRVVSNTT
jgi:hypothetical protein